MRSERGAGTVFVLLIVAVAMAGVGLSYDLGMAAIERSTTVDAVSALAKAGASQLVVGSSTSLDQAAALEAMNELANRSWPALEWNAVVTTDQVVVTAQGSYEPRVLDVFGWSGTSFEVTSAAGAVS